MSKSDLREQEAEEMAIQEQKQLQQARARLKEAQAQQDKWREELQALEGQIADAIEAGHATEKLESQHAGLTARLRGLGVSLTRLQEREAEAEKRAFFAKYEARAFYMAESVKLQRQVGRQIKAIQEEAEQHLGKLRVEHLRLDLEWRAAVGECQQMAMQARDTKYLNVEELTRLQEIMSRYKNASS
jgi:hypothetical protein